jgi:predicted ATPase
MSEVFVSYSSQDRARVKPLVEAIERRGWAVWWDRKIDAGATFDREIETAIDEARCIVVVWSSHSVGSDWVRSEANEGLTRGILVPVAIDPVRPPLAFRLTQTIDMTGAGDSVEALVGAIRRFCPPASRAGREPSPFVGRGEEFAELCDRTGQAAGGAGGLVLLSGEAGVGKSRLVKEIEAHARQQGLLALTGRCVQAEGAPPYQPLLEQIEQAARLVNQDNLRAALGENAPELARLMPELKHQFPDIPEPVALPPDQERRYLLHGCGEFIDRAARAQPMLLVFEDLHWAGESTCRLLRHLAERLHNSPVLMIGTYRATDLESTQPFSQTLHDLVRERLASEIVLERLTKDDVAALLEGRAGQTPPKELVSLIVAETEGNPFFIEELYRHLDETKKLFGEDGAFRPGVTIADTEVPRGVRLIIEHRLAKVGDACRRLLTAAAVAGRQVSYDLLVRIADMAEDPLLEALDQAEAASLVEDVSVGREARYQFVHEQIRQTLLGGLSLPRRQRLHLRVAEALQAGGPTAASRDVGDIAYHLYQAGAAADPEVATRFLLSAAQRAVDAVAFEDALKLLEMADEVALEGDRSSRARIQALRGLSLRGAARIDDALHALSEGLALGEDVEGYVALLRQRGALFVDLYRGAEALPDLEKLLGLARAAHDKALELTAQRLLADAHYRLSLDLPEHADLARDACERTIALARDAGDQKALASALMLTAHFVDYWVDYRQTAYANMAEARNIADALGDEVLSLDVATLSLRVATFSPTEYETRAEEILKRLEALRDPIRLNQHLFWMIVPARNAGHLERSIELCDLAIASAARLDIPPVQYPTFKAFALIDLGRYRDASASIDQEVTAGAHRFGRALQRLGRFLLNGQLGAVDAVLAEAEPLMAECRAINRVWMIEMMANGMVSFCAGSEHHAEAVALIEKIAPDARIGGPARARLSLGTGDALGALELASRARAELAEQGRVLMAAELGELIARCLVQLGRWDEAVGEAGRVIAFCETSGCRHLHWRALAGRSIAHDGLGALAPAAADRDAAGAMLRTLAEAAPSDELRAAFLAQPAARLLQATG